MTHDLSQHSNDALRDLTLACVDEIERRMPAGPRLRRWKRVRPLLCSVEEEAHEAGEISTLADGGGKERP